MAFNRRHILGGAGASLGVLALGAPAVLGQAKPRVVVIGGGPGGATAAKYIAKDSQGKIEVVLVEPKKEFTTCFHSNLYLGDFKKFDEITHTYDKLASAHGVKLNHQMASAIDRAKKHVVLADGSRLSYDRLIVAPGISLKYDSVPGWGKEHEKVMPHAWQAGEQTKILKAKLDAVPDGGTIIMIAPPNPYRCPPGPYERVSMMAHTLKAAGKTKSKIVIIDPKPKFSKQGLFLEGWEKYYPGMVEWLAPDIHEGVKSVDPKTGTVVTGFETYKNSPLVNVIPAQTAGQIAIQAKLVDKSGFCPIDANTMRSTVDSNIFVIGDASIAGAMPKSGFAANSQAKVAAMAVRADLTGSRVFPARYANTCWSLIEDGDVVKVGATYAAKDGKIAATSTFISKTKEPADLRKQNVQENLGWYAGVTADMFS
jgi:sulfide dehydrogenase [flavocytochrome c] flavoprotein subunit